MIRNHDYAFPIPPYVLFWLWTDPYSVVGRLLFDRLGPNNLHNKTI
jgi:hypothetical protein